MLSKHENEIDMNLFASILKDAVAKVKIEEDPEFLNDLKKKYKEIVPFTLRTYVAAYLVKVVMEGSPKMTSRNRHDTRDNQAASAHDWKTHDSHEKISFTEVPVAAHREEQKEHVSHLPKVQIDDSLATTIFIGIGRNRRVYPRDLVGLLVSVAGLDRDRIGDIRVLANYSFIQLFTEDADKAITALNGYDYRGRKLSVSYSRQKDIGDSDGDSSGGAPEEKPLETHANPPVDAFSAAEDAAAYAAAEKAAADKEPFSVPSGKTDTPLV
jgi:hypothetical protein